MRPNLAEPQLLRQVQRLLRDLGIELIRQHPGSGQLAQYVSLGRRGRLITDEFLRPPQMLQGTVPVAF